VCRSDPREQDWYTEYTDKCTVPPGCGKIDGSFYEDDPMYTGLFDKGGRLRPAGSHWSRPEYAETLKILAEEGDEPFYSGRIAEDIVKVVQARGGLLNMKDMESESYPPVLSGRLR
jgi:gamma-glutamyltranspeptidase